MTKFSLNQLVQFKRNSLVNSDSVKICGIVEMPKNSNLKLNQNYIIEYADGWIPNSIRQIHYKLDMDKKYLFVSEKELTLKQKGKSL